MDEPWLQRSLGCSAASKDTAALQTTSGFKPKGRHLSDGVRAAAALPWVPALTSHIGPLSPRDPQNQTCPRPCKGWCRSQCPCKGSTPEPSLRPHRSPSQRHPLGRQSTEAVPASMSLGCSLWGDLSAAPPFSSWSCSTSFSSTSGPPNLFLSGTVSFSLLCHWPSKPTSPSLS